MPKLSMVDFGVIQVMDGAIRVYVIPGDGEDTPDSYTVQASSDGFETVTELNQADTATPFDLDLTNGVKYQIRAFAVKSGWDNSTYRNAVGYYIPSDGLIVTNDPPVASGVSVTGTAQVGQTLTGHYTRTDTEGDPAGTPVFKWYKNNVVIAGATAITYVPVIGDIGATLKFGVVVTSTTGTSPGVEVKSAATSAVIAEGGGGAVTGYFLQKDNNTTPTEGEILAGTSFSITPGAAFTITIPNIGLKNIMVFEPSSEPAKTIVNDTLGDAAINGENAFGEVVTVTTFRGYKTNYQTAFDTALTFKIS